MITVLVAEDHPLVRRGIVGFLGTQPDLAVVAEAADGADALRLALERRPDVAVIDLQLPGLDGVETIRRLTRAQPGTRVKTHVSAILLKLRLTDRTQAAVHAWRHGVLRRETEG